jgi:hypothetical protein
MGWIYTPLFENLKWKITGALHLAALQAWSRDMDGRHRRAVDRLFFLVYTLGNLPFRIDLMVSEMTCVAFYLQRDYTTGTTIQQQQLRQAV